MIKQKITKEKLKTINNGENNRKRKYWTTADDDILRQTIQIHGPNWKIIAEYLEGRNANQCAQRWKRLKPIELKTRKKWTKEEDEKLKILEQQYKRDWKAISQFLPNRTSRQIRERYVNHLDPNINYRSWTSKEDFKVWRLYNSMGSKWSQMAKLMKGRPENMIKNRFYGYIKETYTQEKNPYYVIPKQKRNLNTEQFFQSEINELTFQKCDQKSLTPDSPLLMNLMQFESKVEYSNLFEECNEDFINYDNTQIPKMTHDIFEEQTNGHSIINQ